MTRCMHCHSWAPARAAARSVTSPRRSPRSRSEGGLFGATLDFPDDFPENPPVMTFVSDIFHPNGEEARALWLRSLR